MFSTIDPNNIISLLSWFRIQDPTFVFSAKNDSTVSFQEFLRALLKQCLFISPSGMANQSSSSEGQSLRVSWRVVIRGNMRVCPDPVSDVFSVGACLVGSPEVPRLLSFRTRSSSVSVASAFQKIHLDRSVGDQP